MRLIPALLIALGCGTPAAEDPCASTPDDDALLDWRAQCCTGEPALTLRHGGEDEGAAPLQDGDGLTIYPTPMPSWYAGIKLDVDNAGSVAEIEGTLTDGADFSEASSVRVLMEPTADACQSTAANDAELWFYLTIDDKDSLPPAYLGCVPLTLTVTYTDDSGAWLTQTRELIGQCDASDIEAGICGC